MEKKEQPKYKKGDLLIVQGLILVVLGPSEYQPCDIYLNYDCIFSDGSVRPFNLSWIILRDD
jgi:hypothetical protein